jgi:hypothetical protein
MPGTAAERSEAVASPDREDRSEPRRVERAGAFKEVLSSLSERSSRRERAGAFKEVLSSLSERSSRRERAGVFKQVRPSLREESS